MNLILIRKIIKMKAKINIKYPKFKINLKFLKFLLNKWIIFFICCGIYYCGIKYLPHDKPIATKCEILERYGQERTHKSRTYTDFILVVKANNKIFDIKVNPSAYYNAGQHKYLWFNLTHFDIYKENTTINTIYHIFLILFGFFLFVFISVNFASYFTL